MVRNPQTKIIIGIIAAIFLASFVCCSGFIVIGTMWDDSSTRGKKTSDPVEKKESSTDSEDDAKASGRTIPDDQ